MGVCVCDSDLDSAAIKGTYHAKSIMLFRHIMVLRREMYFVVYLETVRVQKN